MVLAIRVRYASRLLHASGGIREGLRFGRDIRVRRWSDSIRAPTGNGSSRM